MHHTINAIDLTKKQFPAGPEQAYFNYFLSVFMLEKKWAVRAFYSRARDKARVAAVPHWTRSDSVCSVAIITNSLSSAGLLALFCCSSAGTKTTKTIRATVLTSRQRDAWTTL